MNSPKNTGKIANKTKPVIKPPHHSMTPGF
jgi:hypothetical protein